MEPPFCSQDNHKFKWKSAKGQKVRLKSRQAVPITDTSNKTNLGRHHLSVKADGKVVADGGMKIQDDQVFTVEIPDPKYPCLFKLKASNGKYVGCRLGHIIVTDEEQEVATFMWQPSDNLFTRFIAFFGRGRKL